MKCSPFHATAKTSRITSWKRLESKTRSRRRLKRSQMKGILKPNKWFFTQVFRQNAPRSRSDVPDVAEGILKFFPGFNAFALSPPSTDPNVLNNPNTKKDQLQPQFLSELEQFKKMIKSMLVPKHSCNKGELITGEGTCSCSCFSFLPSQFSCSHKHRKLKLERNLKIGLPLWYVSSNDTVESTIFWTFFFNVLLQLLKKYKWQVKEISQITPFRCKIKLSCWNFYAKLTGVSLWCVCTQMQPLIIYSILSISVPNLLFFLFSFAFAFTRILLVPMLPNAILPLHPFTTLRL